MAFNFSLPAVVERTTWHDSVPGSSTPAPTVPPPASVAREEGLLGVSCVTLSVLPSPHVGISPSAFAPLCRLNELGSPSAIDSDTPRSFVAKNGGIFAHENADTVEVGQLKRRADEEGATAIPVDDAVKRQYQSRVSSTRLCSTNGGGSSLGGRGGGCVYDHFESTGCKRHQVSHNCSVLPSQSPISYLHTSSVNEFVPLVSSSNFGSMDDVDSFASD